MRRLPVLGCLAVVPIVLLRLSSPSDPIPLFPRLMLWAWENPQDLRFVKPGSAGIAFLERTVWLNEKSVRSRPRLQPLRFTPGVELMAVVRLESAGHSLPMRRDVVREIMPAVKIAGVDALQIDFDARQSERLWYAALLRELRQAIPAALPLTITALENWCEEDGWIRDLPVSDATPMLFRMGPEDRRTPSDFPSRICRSSIGVSTDELPARVPRARRVFLFHPGSWTVEAYEAAVAQFWRWQR
jgi:Protein of unknown function (DUF3142)